jgi:hypothetical protein
MVRWVNEGSPTEWTFGGGKNGESGRERDSNIIDVAVSVGEGKFPGVGQDTMLNYTTDDANTRFRNGQVAVVLEATRFEDYAPPAIAPLEADGGAVTEWFAMQGAPVVIGSAMTDDDRVADASLRWRGLRGLYSEPVKMSQLLNDLWVADLDFSALASELDTVDGKFYLELRMSASDPSGNSVESRMFTLELDSQGRHSILSRTFSVRGFLIGGGHASGRSECRPGRLLHRAACRSARRRDEGLRPGVLFAFGRGPVPRPHRHGAVYGRGQDVPHRGTRTGLRRRKRQVAD